MQREWENGCGRRIGGEHVYLNLHLDVVSTVLFGILQGLDVLPTMRCLRFAHSSTTQCQLNLSARDLEDTGFSARSRQQDDSRRLTAFRTCHVAQSKMTIAMSSSLSPSSDSLWTA